MPAIFKSINSLDSLERLFESSYQTPVVLFKHSIACGISSGVYREVSQVNATVHIALVQTDRNVSEAIASKTGIRHESPQAIVIKNGLVVYHASHYDITPQAIEANLAVPTAL